MHRTTGERGEEAGRPSSRLHGAYGLKLSDGCSWSLVARDETLRTLVDRFARITELGPAASQDARRILFTRRKDIEERSDPTHGPDAGGAWRIHDLKVIRLWTRGDEDGVLCEVPEEYDHDEVVDVLRMNLALLPIYRRAQSRGGMPMHAALVEWNDEGVLLAGAGSVGKTTCCRRIAPPWRALCDDATLVVHDSERRRYRAHAFPTWSEYLERDSRRSWPVERHVGLSAIFFLEQSSVDEAVPLGDGRAASWIHRSATEALRHAWCNLPRDEQRALRTDLFDNACRLAAAVPSFLLRTSLTGEFWVEMEKAMERIGSRKPSGVRLTGDRARSRP